MNITPFEKLTDIEKRLVVETIAIFFIVNLVSTYGLYAFHTLGLFIACIYIGAVKRRTPAAVQWFLLVMYGAEFINFFILVHGSRVDADNFFTSLVSSLIAVGFMYLIIWLTKKLTNNSSNTAVTAPTAMPRTTAKSVSKSRISKNKRKK